MTTNKPTTMFELGQQNAEMEVGGRFAPARPYVVGSEETTVNAPLPPSPIDWSVDGKEPSLGFSVEEVPQMETIAHGGSEFAPQAAPCPYLLETGECHLVANQMPCVCAVRNGQ